MIWGSTTYGEIFTGSKRWRASIDGSRVSVEADGKQQFSVPIERMRGMRVDPGVLWATCHFEYEDRGNKNLAFDGIPNAHAAEMKQVLSQQLDQYHAGVFGKALASWQAKFTHGQGWGRWVPKGNAARFCAHRLYFLWGFSDTC